MQCGELKTRETIVFCQKEFINPREHKKILQRTFHESNLSADSNMINVTCTTNSVLQN